MTTHINEIASGGIHPLFNEPNANVIFKSSDGVIFKLHSKDLSTASKGFSVHESMTLDADPAILTEPAAILEILFQFIQPPNDHTMRQPPVMDMDPALFFGLAEAAEKYSVYGAQNTCITRMQYTCKENPIEILNHCWKHGYHEIADTAAPFTLPFTLSKAAEA